MSLPNEDTTVVRSEQQNGNGNIGETITRGGFNSSSHLNSSANFATSHYSHSQQLNARRGFFPPCPQPPFRGRRFGPYIPPWNPPGRFEHGPTNGSSSYSSDQSSSFIGNPWARYRPHYFPQRHFNRFPRRQFSPFVHFQRYQRRFDNDSCSDRFAPNNYRGSRFFHYTHKFRGRGYPLNHNWSTLPTTVEEPAPTVYSTCALVIWVVDGYYGFLCEKNTNCGNLHFYADSSTIVQEEGNKRLGELPDDRILRGHRVEIETEFLEPDLSDPEIHHLVYVRSLAKLGTEISTEAIRHHQFLVPLACKKPAQYYRAISEDGELVYVHPSILLAPSLIDSMKDRLSSTRPPCVEETMNVLSTKHTLLGDVTIAPRWLGDVIGRACIFKRVLISYESYGDLLHGYGTVTKVLPYSIIVKSESDGEFIWCSLLSVCPWLKVPFNVGEYVRYTACLNMPNSEYKWRCLRIGRTSRININNYKNLTPIKAESSQCILDENVEQASKQLLSPEDDDNLIDLHSECAPERNEGSESKDICLVDIISEESKSDGDLLNKQTSLNISSSLVFQSNVISSVNEYPSESDEEIALCMIESSRNIFRYGDEPHCNFTKPDKAKGFHHMNSTSLDKSMEDVRPNCKGRKEKNRRRARNELENRLANTPKSSNKKVLVDSDTSTTEFQFVDIDDDVEKVLTPDEDFHTPQYPDGWWYRRTTRRQYPTVFVAEFIEVRDVEEDCKRTIDVRRLKHSLTIRNSGIFVDDGLPTNCSVTTAKAEPNCLISKNKENEANIMSLLGNDKVIAKFFSPLLKNLPQSLEKKHD